MFFETFSVFHFFACFALKIRLFVKTDCAVGLGGEQDIEGNFVVIPLAPLAAKVDLVGK